MQFINIIFFIALAALLPGAHGHSWVEQLMVIGQDGTFVGEPGYPRGNVRRGAPGFGDPAMVHLLPPNGRAGGNVILDSDPMCKESQSKPVQTEGSPALKAAPGSMIALRFQENGHVTLPDTQAGKPKNRGNVYIYGTTEPKPDDTLLGIHNVWNAEGTGGDKRGKLLATQAFDDGQCYQINGGAISKTRQEEFPHEPSPLMGADLWCQNNIRLPAEATAGKPYTIYWVWDWPTAPNAEPGLTNGKQEVYTTCMDIEITDEKPVNKAVKNKSSGNFGNGGAFSGPYSSNNGGNKKDIGNMAVPSLFEQLQSGNGNSPTPTSSPSSASSSSASSSSEPTSSQSSAQQSPSASSGSPAAPFATTVTVTKEKLKPTVVPMTCACLPPEALEKRSADVSISVSTTTEKETVTVTATATATIYATGTTLARQSNPTPAAVSEAELVESSSTMPTPTYTTQPSHGKHGRRWSAGRFRF